MLSRFARLSRQMMVVLALAVCGVSLSAAQDLQDVNRLIKQGQNAQALDKLNAYLAGKPKDPLARFLKGVVLTEQGKTNEAISLFQALTEEYPELPEPYNNLAVLYASKGQYEKAKVSLEMAIQTHPSYATAHENLGDIYAKMASAAYDKALQLDKSNKSAETKLSLIRDMFPANGKPSAGKGTSAKVIVAAAPPKDSAKAPASTAASAVVPAVTTPLPAAPTVAAAPATETPSAPPKPALPANEAETVLGTVSAWAKAWSDRDLEAYVGFYLPGYHTQGETHDAWKSARRDRILAPKRISVGVLNPKVALIDPTHAKVTFRQDYKSDRLSTQSSKTLLLEKHGSAWLIAQEHSGK